MSDEHAGERKRGDASPVAAGIHKRNLDARPFQPFVIPLTGGRWVPIHDPASVTVSADLTEWAVTEQSGVIHRFTASEMVMAASTAAGE